MVVTASAPPLGNIQRPTEGFLTELVDTKPTENQTFGQVLVYDAAGPYYKIAPTNATSHNFAIVVDTWTNQGAAALNADIDGRREVLTKAWEIVVKLTTSAIALKPGEEVKVSATVPGTVDRFITGTDTDRGTIVGRFVKKASEWTKSAGEAKTNAVAGDNIIIYKYGSGQ